MTSSVVCLLRDADDAGPYLRALEAAGWTAFAVPVLRFVYVNREALQERIEHPERYAGLILTSPRAAAALADLSFDLSLWAQKPVFVVGPRTGTMVRQSGLQPSGEDTGSAEELAPRIVGTAFAAPLLFLCGNRRRDVLPQRLAAGGVACEELCVYETHLVAPDFTGHPTPDWVVFFSPSGVEAARQADGFDWGSARKAAIGATTAAALAAETCPAETIAASPTPEALVEALGRAGPHPGLRETLG